MKKKRYLITTIAIVVGVVLLATAAFANNQNANGYQRSKDAAIKFLTLENYTFNSKISILVDNELHTQSDSYIESSRDTAQYSKSTNTQYIDYEGNKIASPEPHSNISYYQDGKKYYLNTNDDTYYSYETDYSSSGLPNIDPEDETQNAAIRFASLLADSIVGDLKNSVALIESKDGIDTYSLNLQGQQIPEIISAGFDLASTTISGIQSYEGEENPDPMYAKIANGMSLDSIKGKTAVDNDGNLRGLSIDVTIIGKDKSGNAHPFNIKVDITINNIGTTVPERLDLSKVTVEEESRYYSEPSISDIAASIQNDPILNRDVLVFSDNDKYKYNIDLKTGYLIDSSTGSLVPVDSLMEAAKDYAQQRILDISMSYDPSRNCNVIYIYYNLHEFLGEDNPYYTTYDIMADTGYVSVLDELSGLYSLIDPVTLESIDEDPLYGSSELTQGDEVAL